jgi:hypothetical protein
MIRARNVALLAERPRHLRTPARGETPLSAAEVQFGLARGLIQALAEGDL